MKDITEWLRGYIVRVQYLVASWILPPACIISVAKVRSKAI